MDITSPMPGKVFAINVQIGTKVDEDTAVITLESMKMEVPVFAPDSGVITKVTVKVGDVINAGSIVAILD